MLIGLADAVGEDEEGVDAVNNSERHHFCSVCDHNNMLNIDHKRSQLPPSGADGEGETRGAVSH